MTPLLVDEWLYREACRERDEARAELKELRGQRIVSVVFGHHRGAPRPFALRRTEDVTGVSGTGIVALGVEWPDGLVVLRWTSDWPTSVVFHDRGMESVEAVHGHGGKTQVVWLSDELEPLAAMEVQLEAATAGRDALLPAVQAARRLLTLKDGPRDRGYELAKPLAWDVLRTRLAAVDAYEARVDAAKIGDRNE